MLLSVAIFLSISVWIAELFITWEKTGIYVLGEICHTTQLTLAQPNLTDTGSGRRRPSMSSVPALTPPVPLYAAP
eukprot:5666029-Prymnesium_polylepis.1